MSLIRWNSYDPFLNIDRTMARMLDQMRIMMDTSLIPSDGEVWVDHHTNPLAVDMTSDEHHIIIRTALPGFKEDEINLDVQHKMLTISAETKSENQNQQANWHLREMRYGKFARSISLPEEVMTDNADASLENGILTVKLPKQKPTIAQRIAVKARRLLPNGNKKGS
jgi:HSP20 family protein